MLEYGENLVGIEVKWSGKISKQDLQDLKSANFFIENLKDCLKYFIFLYSRNNSVIFSEKLAEIPFDIFFLG